MILNTYSKLIKLMGGCNSDMRNFNLESIVNNKPYIIAEIGVNHEGSIDLAKKLIDLAVEGGADSAKFQTYKAEKLAVKNSPAYWDLTKESTTSQYQLFKKYDAFEKDDYIELKAYCDQKGIDFLSTPFDIKSVRFLSELMPFFKIASADITNIPLLREVAKYDKPIVLSTGASTIWEIENAVNELVSNGVKEVGLLHCMLNYPTEYKNASLSMIKTLKRLFPNRVVGYSDHTVPESDMLTVTTAVSFGARIVEKHFTHDKSLPGNDHYHAMDIDDLKVLMNNVSRLKLITKETDQNGRSKELSARLNARRSVVLVKNMSKGDVISSDCLTCKRPAFGISPVFWDDVIGKTLLRSLNEDHILKWEDIS
jgi:sialic acid synthase SpsE